jgi:phospholipase C
MRVQAVVVALAGLLVALAPPPAQPERSGSPIKHVIEIMLENHTFDNLYGHFPGADGIPAGTQLPNPQATWSYQPPVSPFVAGLNQGTVQGDIDNSHYGELMAMDYRPHGGYGMDLFARYPQNGLSAITGFDPALDPNQQFLAHAFELADHNFQPLIAPTQPNVITALTGDAHGWLYNDNSPATITYDSIFDELNSYRRSFRVYYGVPRSHLTGTVWERLVPGDHEQDLTTTSAFFSDLRSGRLPDFSLIRPGVGYSTEPWEDVQPGDAWVGQLVQTVMDSPLWKDTAIFVTYDEGGGLWDHAAPPVVGQDGYGTRTPTLIISPYTRQGVFHAQTTNISILSFMQRQWSMRPLNALNASQNDLTAAFDFHRRPLSPVRLPVTPPITLRMGGGGGNSTTYSAPVGSPFTVNVLATDPALDRDTGLTGPVTLTVASPPGAPEPSGLPGTVNMAAGAASVTVVFPTPGYYRLTASGPSGSLGWVTIGAGVTPLTP